jgi:hypothetical protein
MSTQNHGGGSGKAKHLSISEEMARDFERSSSPSLAGETDTPIEAEVRNRTLSHQTVNTNIAQPDTRVLWEPTG